MNLEISFNIVNIAHHDDKVESDSPESIVLYFYKIHLDLRVHRLNHY